MNQYLKLLIETELKRIMAEQNQLNPLDDIPNDTTGLPPVDPSAFNPQNASSVPSVEPNHREGDQEKSTDKNIEDIEKTDNASGTNKEEPEDSIQAIVDVVIAAGQKTTDVPRLVGAAKKAILDTFGNFNNAMDIANALAKAGVEAHEKTLTSVGNSLGQFLFTKTEGRCSMKLTEARLMQIIKEEYEGVLQNMPQVHLPERIPIAPEQPQGNPHFMAVRQLGIMARDAALSFETKIWGELKLRNPDTMDASSQNIYRTAMEDMQSQIVAAIVDAIEKVVDLPKEDETAKPASKTVA